MPENKMAIIDDLTQAWKEQGQINYALRNALDGKLTNEDITILEGLHEDGIQRSKLLLKWLKDVKEGELNGE